MSELYHYGIKGQKHGVRKYQNEDGSLTPEGKIHYGVGDGRKSKVIFKPGEKPSNIVKKAIKQTKNDFKNDMKLKKPIKKSSKAAAQSVVKKHMSKKTKAIIAGSAVAAGAAIVASLIGVNISKKNKINANNERVANETKLREKLKRERVERNEKGWNNWQKEENNKYFDYAMNKLNNAKKIPFDLKTGIRDSYSFTEADEYKDYLKKIYGKT